MSLSGWGDFTSLKKLLSFNALVVTSILLSGCFETKEDVPAKVTQGTIQGKLIDSQTLEPIVGASIDMGGTVVLTNAQGKYSIPNIVVPIDASGTVKSATYKVTVDLRQVSSPVNMTNAAITPRYPDLSYDYAAIQFSAASTTSTANPVTYLKENIDFKVGKLAAVITGVVANKLTLQPVAAGYTVQLIALGTGTAPGGSGVIETIVGSTVTDINGTFTFANIETLKDYRIEAWNTDQTFKGVVNVTSLNEGVTLTLSVQANNAVIVSSTDTSPLLIVRVTPENNADISPAPLDVVYTFSRPILQTADTSTSPTVTTGLYNKVDVKYLGAKASNISHSLAWNSTFTQLTISIPSLAASSKYTVDITPANALFRDVNGNALDNTTDKRVLNFTTNGAVTPAAPGPISAVNNSSLNYNSPTVLLDWLPVSGAKGYNVYRAQNYPGVAGQLQLMGSTSPSTLTSDFSDTLPAAGFVSGQNKLTYTYSVKSVSADNIESAASASLVVQDLVLPTVTIPTGLASTYTITFSEPVDEITATNLSNYILSQGAAGAVPVITGAVLNAGLTTVTLTLNAATLSGNVLAVTNVTDIAGNAIANTLRTF